MVDKEMMKHNELVAWFEQSLQDIRFLKSSLWNTLYLTILGISAVTMLALTLLERIGDELCTVRLIKVLLISFVIVVVAIGIWVNSFHMRALGKSRGFVAGCRELMRCQAIKNRVPERDPSGDKFFLWFYPTAMIIAALLIIGIILIA